MWGDPGEGGTSKGLKLSVWTSDTNVSFISSHDRTKSCLYESVGKMYVATTFTGIDTKRY